MDISHLKNSELKKKYQKYKGRVALRGDIVKDDSASYAVFTETRFIGITNGGRKSHGYDLTATWLRRTSIGRSICLLTLTSKSKMLQNCSKFQNRSVQTFGYVYHDTNGTNYGPVWKIQSFLWNEICMVILGQDCCGKGNLRKFYWSTVGKSSKLAKFVHREKGLFLSVYVDDINLACKKENINPMWKVLNKEVGLGEPTSWDVLNDIAKHANILLTLTEPCSNPEFGQAQRRNYHARKP